MNDIDYENDGIERSKERIKKNGEVFTPTKTIDEMMAKIPEETWKDPSKTFLDPTAGSGNIVCRMLEKRLSCGITKKDAISTLYGIELMQDNVDKIKERLVDILGTHEFDEIIDHNIVCSDFFKWNLLKWRPKTDEEILNDLLAKKRIKKK